jgi:hypothetical protein
LAAGRDAHKDAATPFCGAVAEQKKYQFSWKTLPQLIRKLCRSWEDRELDIHLQANTSKYFRSMVLFNDIKSFHYLLNTSSHSVLVNSK